MRKRLAEKVQRVAAANPTQFDAAKLYVARGLNLTQATHLLRISFAAALLKQNRCNRSAAARDGGMHRNTFGRIIARI